MPPIGVPLAASRASALLVSLLLLVSCSGGDGGEGARPSISPTRTPTATLPTPELPSVTRSPSRTTSAERPTPTRSPEQTDSADQPSPTRSPEQTDSADQPFPTRSPVQSQSPAQPTPTAPSVQPDSPDAPLTQGGSALPTQDPTATQTVAPDSAEAEAEAPSEDEGVPTWVWWLLAALILGSAIAIPLVVRARHRNAWHRELAAAAGELAWFARELLPSLRQAGSLEQVAGGWRVGQARVAAAEDRLTVLESTAPEDADREQARSLRDASRQARGRMQQLTDPGPSDTWALDLDAIIADLEEVLRRPVQAD